MAEHARDAAKEATSSTQSSPGRPQSEYTRTEPKERKERTTSPGKKREWGRGKEQPGPGPGWEPAWHTHGKVRAKQAGRENRM